MPVQLMSLCSQRQHMAYGNAFLRILIVRLHCGLQSKRPAMIFTTPIFFNTTKCPAAAPPLLSLAAGPLLHPCRLLPPGRRSFLRDALREAVLEARLRVE